MRHNSSFRSESLKQLVCCLVAGGLLVPAGLLAQQGAAARTGTARAATAYPSSTDIGQARITYDPETRSVIIVSDEDTAAHIQEVVRELDRPAPQVLIKCVFMEATHSKGSDIGVDGTYRHRISGSKVNEINTPAGLNNTATTAFDLATSGGIYTLLGNDLDITIAALASAGKTEILSRPSILARNNQQATITIGQQVPLISGVTFDSFGNQRNAISYQSVGIILTVTPFITSDGMVEMIVSPEISSVSDSTVSFATGGTNNAGSPSAPIINIRSADTVVVVPDGQTVVIGGLMQNVKTKTEQKVPILGDIPLLGLLFKHKKTADEKKELLIFMTPYIINRPTEMSAHTDSERNKAEISRKAFSEEDINRYLDIAPAGQDNPATPPGPSPAPPTFRE